MARLDRLFIGRDGNRLFQTRLTFRHRILEMREQHIGIGNLEIILAVLAFLFQKHITICHARIIISEVKNAILVLDIHGEAFQAICQLARNRLTIKAAHLLKIGKLRHLHPVTPYFPAKAPCAQRRAFPIILDKADVVEQRVDADRSQATQIKFLQLWRRWFQDNLILVIMAQPVRVFAVTPVGRPSARLDKGGVPRLWSECAKGCRGMECPRTHFEIIGLHHDATLLPPIGVEAQDQVLKAKRLRIAGHRQSPWRMTLAKSRLTKPVSAIYRLDGEQKNHLIAVMIKTTFKTLFAASALYLFSIPAMAQDNQPLPAPTSSATAPKTVDADPALWVIKDADTTIYLFGTVHILKPGLSWFDESVKQSFDKSDRLVLELVEPPAAETQSAFTKYAVDQSGKTLRSKLNDKDKATYEKAMQGVGIPAEAFDPFDPWAAAVTMQMVGMMKQGFQPGSGVESVLTAQAKATKKPIEGVETLESQLTIFDTLPQETQLAFLIETAGTMDEMNESFDKLIDSWTKAETDKLAALMNEGLTDPVIYDKLLTQRNANWAKWIDEQMKKPGTTFMAVGAGHLAGKNSVQELLASYGLKAERVLY
jgi:uncharacterized protein